MPPFFIQRGNMSEPFEYLYIDSVIQRGEVSVWTRDEAGLSIETFDARDFYYCFIPDNTDGAATYKDMWGVPMKKCSFESRRDMKEFTEGENYVCESDVSPKYKVLIDRFRDASETAKFHYCLYDIEVDFDLADGFGYPKPDNAYGEINLIQCFDNYNNCYTMFILDHLKDTVKLVDDKFDVKIVWCWSEHDMLQKFAAYLDPMDVLAGWFSAGFDLPYIMQRAIKLFGEDRALTMFCRDGFRATSREFMNEFGNEVIEWQLVGRKHIDLMAIYKKFIPGQRPSFSLDAICEEDLGVGKVQYEDEGDLGTLYRTDPQKFCEYGLHDARLMFLLNDKHNLMATAMALAVQSCVTVDDVTGSVKPIEMNLIKFCREKGNIVLPDKQQWDEPEFPGAIVYDTVSGRHEWVLSADLAALYPSAMIMLGLSPETVVGQLEGEYDDYVAVMKGSDEEVLFHEKHGSTVVDSYSINARDLKQVILDEGFVISANGTIFNGTLGIVAEYIKDGVERRNDAKAKAKEW